MTWEIVVGLYVKRYIMEDKAHVLTDEKLEEMEKRQNNESGVE